MFSRVPNPAGPDATTVGTEQATFPPLDPFDDNAFNNLASDAEWWLDAIEEDSFDSPLPFDASEGGLWNGRFVPPPPRPPWLDESVASDGLTTCDLCTWAWHDRNAFSLDGSIGGKYSTLSAKHIASLIETLFPRELNSFTKSRSSCLSVWHF